MRLVVGFRIFWIIEAALAHFVEAVKPARLA